ncbi:hypothetical protein BDV38DRAFT_255664 [Aspergillus pseudotamarii]|uniref:Autophagy-related protein Atg28 n=1 Tax=Aspergillus pseudotamarii TaxID=132259 RepID=A0A5N6SI23_ASPPS|nr:uncharacterized protein BDV38DRAFT_255664 [Aspergillus pseudotamarii]KAE8134336.1 hypothetical protein BDV38DRAFT_255664 [Aspergillus pseudotamarii]
MSTTIPKHGDSRLLSLPIRASVYHQDPLIYIDRQAKHIQHNLQALIDAQSEGLLAGLQGPQLNETPTGSSTPSTEPSILQKPLTVPVRQPVTEKISLRAAREGIFKSIFDLLKLREEEREILTARVAIRTDALDEINSFTTKRAGLEEAVSTIHNNKESQRTEELREEGHKLEADIHELETKLSLMRARHRHVVEELAYMENSVDSKLSSYKASLSLLESDIQKFLQNPPVPPQSSSANGATLYSLNPKRRTLDMAREHWTTEQSELRKRQEEVGLEIQALEAGGGVWKQVILEVYRFERRLKVAMRRSLQNQSQASESSRAVENNSELDHVRGILEDLHNTTEHVEHCLGVAEEKNWKLLVCCVAAELEALREAREMLLDAFDISDEDPSQSSERRVLDKSGEDNPHDLHQDPLGVDNPDPPADLLQDTEEHHSDTISRSEDEDDEPDPAWLLPET